MSATTPREAVERFVALMVDDPVRGRALLLAPEAEPALANCGSEWMPNFIELLQRKLTAVTDPAIQAMTATSLIGGLTALFVAYLNGRLPTTREQFIDYCVAMLMDRSGSRSVPGITVDRPSGNLMSPEYTDILTATTRYR